MLGITIALPIPFANALPAMALIAFSVGILMRDGLAVVAGMILSVAAAVRTGIILLSGVRSFDWLWNALGIG